MTPANPINITAIDHVVLRVVDLNAMIAFYRDVLGCRLERGPAANGLAQLRAGQSLIDLVDVAAPLGNNGGEPPDHNAHNMDHFCLQVQPWDGEAIFEHLKAYDVVMGPIAPRYGSTGMGPSLYLTDPEGNSVELKGTPLPTQ